MSPTSGQCQIEENHSTNEASEDFLDIEKIDNSFDSTDSFEIPFSKLTQSMKLTVEEECNHSIVVPSVLKSNVNVDGLLKKHSRVWNCPNFCLYCKYEGNNLSRHIQVKPP